MMSESHECKVDKIVDTEVSGPSAKINRSRVKRSRLVVRYGTHLPRGRVDREHFWIKSRSEGRIYDSDIRSVDIQRRWYGHEARAVATTRTIQGISDGRRYIYTYTYRLSSRTKLLSTVMNDESIRKLQWTSQLNRHHVNKNYHTLGIVDVALRSVGDSDG
jgi:hypothetical protein